MYTSISISTYLSIYRKYACIFMNISMFVCTYILGLGLTLTCRGGLRVRVNPDGICHQCAVSPAVRQRRVRVNPSNAHY